MVATFGREGPPELAPAEPLALCGAIERLLDDAERRSSVARAGIELVAERTWERAARQLEQGIRVAGTLNAPQADNPGQRSARH
jgi:hypothetical protein